MATKIDKDLKIIKRTMSGVLQTDQAIKLVRDLSMAAKLQKGSNILLDLRGTVIGPEMIDLMAITSAFSTQLSTFDDKIALIITYAEGSFRFATLFKACLVAQGFAFNHFYDYNTAVEWLSK